MHPTENAHAFGRAKTAGNLLLEFQHSQIALRTVVVEGNCQIGHKRQHLCFIPDKLIQ